MLIVTCLFGWLLIQTYAAPAPQANSAKTATGSVDFERREEMIPMRDGVRLHTLIFIPRAQTEALPILFNRTPYGVGGTTAEGINERYQAFVKDGYILRDRTFAAVTTRKVSS